MMKVGGRDGDRERNEGVKREVGKMKMQRR